MSNNNEKLVSYLRSCESLNNELNFVASAWVGAIVLIVNKKSCLKCISKKASDFFEAFVVAESIQIAGSL